MSQELSIGATGTPSDSGAASTAGSTPSPQDTTSAPSEQSAGGATADVQGKTSEPDVFEGVPTREELDALPDDTKYKKSIIQLREAIEKNFQPKLSELTEKYSIFEPYSDRFEKPEEVQELVELKDKLFGYARDEQTGELVPSTRAAAELINEKYLDHADSLTTELMYMPTVDPDTGRKVSRLELVLEAMKDVPEQRAHALRILGGVEPTAIAPTWQPSEEELTNIAVDPDNLTTQDKQLQDIYRRLPYDERQALRLNDPEYIRSALKKEQMLQRMTEENRVNQEQQAQHQQRLQQEHRQREQNAGNQYVEEGFRTGFTEFANSVVERSQFLQPITPDSPEGQQLGPQGLAEMNGKISRVNQGVGRMVAACTAALAHPDTAWIMQDFLKAVGVDDKTLANFDNSRTEYARNARDYGELNYSASQNGGQPNNGLGTLQSNSTRAMKSMKGYANAVAEPLLSLLSEYFEMKAVNYNQTLNGAPTTRPSVNGDGFDPTTAPVARPSGFMSRDEIQRKFG